MKIVLMRPNMITNIRLSKSVLAACAVAVLMIANSVDAQEAKTEKTTFDDHVKAVFAQRCASCHNPNKRSSDLDVTNFTNLMQGGASGAVVEPGDPDFSRLFELVNHDDEPKMPPDSKIPQEEIDLIKKWIDGGALENMGSTAVVKKKMGLTMVENPLERPTVVAVPPRLMMEPVVHTDQNGLVPSIATSPWAPLAAIAGQRQVLLYNTSTLEFVGMLPFPEGAVNIVKFSRNGQVLLAAGGQNGASGKVVLWDVATGERIGTVGDEIDAVLAADISADHSQVAIGGSSRSIKVYSTLDGKLQFEMTKPTEWVMSVEFSPDGVLLATGDRNGGLYVWEATTGREYLTLKGHTGSINSLSWRGDSNILASASQDTTIRLWEMENGSQVKSWGAHGGGAAAIEFARDGRILSTGRDRVTKFWDQNGQQVKAFPAGADIGLSASWCDETSRAIAGDFSGEIRVWQESDAAQLAVWTANPPALSQRLASAKSLFDQKSAELQPQQQNLNQITAQLTAVESQLGEAQQIQVAATQAVSGLDTEIKTANVQKTETDQLRGQITDKLTRVTEAKPLVSEALRNLIEASAKLTENQALGQQAESLTQQLKQMDGEITALTSQLDGLKNKMSETDTQLATASDKMKQAQQELKLANENVAALQAKLKPLQEQKQQALTTVTQLTAAVNGAKAQTEKWQGEIDFVTQLVELRQRLAAAQQVVDERQTTLEQAQSQLSEAQSAVNAAQQSKGEADGQVNQILEELGNAKQIKK